MKTIAITRRISPAINQCELTHLQREPINFERACVQHQKYEEALKSLAVEVVSLPADENLPDSVFVEDAALVLDECAVLTNPGALSRRPEVAAIRTALEPYREIFRIEPPATVDGGDILQVGKRVFIGQTSRSSDQAIFQMGEILAPFGYQVHPVPVTGCLHLKSAATQVAPDTLLINPNWVSPIDFPGLKFIPIDPTEPNAANALLISDTVIYPTAFPKTRSLLQKTGIPLLTINADELAKAEGALTCCSLLLNTP